MKLLSICFLNFNDHQKLYSSIPHMMGLVNNLPNNLRDEVEIVISDNRSDSVDEVKKLLKQHPTIKFISTTVNTGVDVNIRNCFEKADSSFVWVFSADDYIHSVNHLETIINFLSQHKPTMVRFLINLELIPGQLIKGVQFKRIGTKAIIKQLLNAGKISTAIYSKPKNFQDVLKSADKFIGLGYYHLSYGACLHETEPSNWFYWDVFSVFTLHAQENHKHEYHPRFSQNAHLSIATDKMLNKSFVLRCIVNYHLVFQLRFVLGLSSKSEIGNWDEHMALCYVEEIGYRSRKVQKVFFEQLFNFFA